MKIKTIDKKNATASLAQFASDIASGPIVVTSSGAPIAALIPLENEDLESVSLSLNPKFLGILERSRARHRAEGGISTEEMKSRLAGKKTQSNERQYWIVGAARTGRDDHYEEFVGGGYWELFWTDQEQPSQAAKRDQMRRGDRIAIKKMVGGKNGNGKVMIRAIGVVKTLDAKRKRVKVRWEKKDLNQEIGGHSLYQSVHGPFSGDSKVVRDVFGE